VVVVLVILSLEGQIVCTLNLIDIGRCEFSTMGVTGIVGCLFQRYHGVLEVIECILQKRLVAC
jgi:hypothetical protein